MSLRHFILADDGKTPVPTDLLTWARWTENRKPDDFVLAKTRVGKLTVSTVFLGLDHSHRGPPPVLWETMVFGAPDGHEMDGYCERYTSFAEADVGHWELVARLKQEGTP